MKFILLSGSNFSFISFQSANGFPDLEVVDLSCDYYGLDRRNDQLLYRWDSNDILSLSSNLLIKCDYSLNLHVLLVSNHLP